MILEHSRGSFLVLAAVVTLGAAAGLLSCAKVDIAMHQNAHPAAGSTDGDGSRVTSITSTAHAKMTLDDPDLGPWMRINNTFIDPDRNLADDNQLWHGVLIQLGGWYKLDATVSDRSIWFHSVSIRHATGTTVLECSTNTCTPSGLFEWINIVPRSDSRKAPLPDPASPDSRAGDPNFLKILYPKTGTEGICEKVENDCGCATADECNTTSATLGCSSHAERKFCLRQRSLHAYFVPEAVLTYWAGDRGYDVTVTGDILPTQVFTFKDPIDVYVHKNVGVGSYSVDLYSDVKEITIRHWPHVEHGTHKDPPMGGGG